MPGGKKKVAHTADHSEYLQTNNTTSMGQQLLQGSYVIYSYSGSLEPTTIAKPVPVSHTSTISACPSMQTLFSSIKISTKIGRHPLVILIHLAHVSVYQDYFSPAI